MRSATVETTEQTLHEIDPQAGDVTDEQRPADDQKPEEKAEDDKEEEKKPAVDPVMKEMRRAMQETRRALAESQKAAQYWMEQARNAPKKEAPAKEEDDGPELSVDLLDAVTNRDGKAFRKAMRQLGFVDEREVERRLAGVRAVQSHEAKLYARFPDLDDEQSEFFQETAKIYNDLCRRDPSLKNSALTSEMAAEIAEKRLGIYKPKDSEEPKPRKRTAEADMEFDEEPDEDEERERIERVARQSGARTRNSSRQDNPRSEELDEMQKSIVAKLRAAGADISEDGYRKRALKGVRMAGLPTRRPRY